jgi:hypothetical protein
MKTKKSFSQNTRFPKAGVEPRAPKFKTGLLMIVSLICENMEDLAALGSKQKRW